MDWQFKPARDLGLPLRRRLASQHRETGLASALIYWGFRQTIRTYLRSVHRLSVIGAELLPDPPFVMVANHASHLDAITLAAALPLKLADRAHPIAAADTFFTSLPVSAFAAYAINALPLWRKGTKPEDLAAFRDRLVEDALIYILFPEGTRSRTGTMARFQPGIGTFVAGTSVPVVPTFLEGAYAALPPHRRLPRPVRLRLTIGRALTFAETTNDRRGWLAIAKSCEDAVRRLGGLEPHAKPRDTAGSAPA
ncbi:MAG: 1-acyl-sn-glycerol-3-phosphate acyltransferase [Proteobacteria bacterium]|nr:1-acyl-sn-glycerol-3-phosphate acyltransferase [Pseudomonadota bacterium]